ncbi:MAG: LUD domain-containing protein, partial [Chitinophagaceae bacterium]|nr:LUD domain-containing protein [Chitinophagaceae bacterium]
MHTFKTSKAKENILGKIRKELNKSSVEMPFPEIEQRQKENVYPNTGQSVEEVFAENFNALGGKFVFCANEQELIEGLHTLYDSRGWKKLLSAEEHILETFKSNSINICHSADDTPEDADACITGCETMVARTGSVILSSQLHMGRTSSVFYPVHIIIAYADQVVFDI